MILVFKKGVFMRYRLLTLAMLAACGKHATKTYYYGRDGVDGKSGANGSNAVVSMVAFSGVSGSCNNGGITILTATDTNTSGMLDSGDANLMSNTLCNGDDGLDGTDGADAPPSSFTPVAIVDPCLDSIGIYDEVLLRLFNGQLLASFSDNSNGLNTRFSIIGQGTYSTTDGSHCTFSIDSNGYLYNEHF